MENVNISKGRELHFIGAAYVDGYLWTNALEWNGYYRVDIKTGKAEFLGLFDHADVLADKMFYQVLLYKKYIFFIPWFSDYLVRLDTKNLDTNYWKLPKCIVAEKAKFRAANIHNGQIFMFPHLGDDICIFHIEEERFECDKKWISDYTVLESVSNKDRFLQGCKKGKFVYLPNLGGSFLVKYDMERYESEMIVFPHKERKIIDIKEYGDNELLILTWSGNIWKYNIYSMQKEIVYKCRENDNNLQYSHILLVKNILYLIPVNGKDVEELERDKINKILYPIGWNLQYIDVGIDYVFLGYMADENQFLLYPCKGNMLLRMKIGQKCFSGMEIYEDSRNREKAIRKYLETNGISEIINEPKADLGLFLNCFTEKNRGKDEYMSGMYGVRIWSQMERGLKADENCNL